MMMMATMVMMMMVMYDEDCDDDDDDFNVNIGGWKFSEFCPRALQNHVRGTKTQQRTNICLLPDLATHLERF